MSGINTSNLDEALKRLYNADYVTKAQNISTPFLASIGDATDFTFGGESMRFGVELSGNESVRFGTEDGLLPTPGNITVKQATVTAKELFATFRFTGRAQAATANSAHSFVNAVTGNINDAFQRLKVYEEGAMFRDGTGKLGLINGNPSTAVITVDNGNLHWFRKNQTLEFWRADVKVAGPVAVSSVSASNSQVTLASDISASLLDNDAIYKAGTHNGSITAREVLGLDAVVGASGSYLGIDRDAEVDFRGHPISMNGADLDEDSLERLEERIMDQGGVESLDAFKIVTSTNQRRKYLELVRSQKRFAGMNMDAGSGELNWNERPIMFVYSCPADDLYMGDFSKLERYTLTGGELKLSDIGGVIKWAPNYDAGFGYWRGYFEYACRKPNAFGKLDGLATATV